MISQKTAYTTLFGTSVTVLAIGLYLEHVIGFEPCPLCILQRIAYMAIAGLSFFALLHCPKNFFAVIYHVLIFAVAITGLAIAGRQIWLQHLPEDKVPECGPGFDYMLDTFPLSDALQMILISQGECAEVQWRFLGMSIAEWSAVCFTILAVMSLVMMVCHKRLIAASNKTA